MIITCLRHFLMGTIISVGACFLGAGFTWWHQGAPLACDLVYSWFIHFNGFFIGGTTFGLVTYIFSTRRLVTNHLNNILVMDETTLNIVLPAYPRSRNLVKIFLILSPIWMFGVYILWRSEYPLCGFARIFLAVGSMSTYVVGTVVLAHVIEIIRLFYVIEKNRSSLRLTANASQMEYDNLNSYFVVSSIFMLSALLLCFRGTLTANFENPDVKTFFLYPLMAYLPPCLLFGFYPRFAIADLIKQDAVRKVEELAKRMRGTGKTKQQSPRDILETENLIADLRGKLVAEARKSSVLGTKDAPSFVLALLLVWQFIVSHDPVTKEFFLELFK